jgi:hypothetical protein
MDSRIWHKRHVVKTGHLFEQSELYHVVIDLVSIRAYVGSNVLVFHNDRMSRDVVMVAQELQGNLREFSALVSGCTQIPEICCSTSFTALKSQNSNLKDGDSLVNR